VPGESAISLEGTVVAVLKASVLYQVELANGHRLLGHVPARRRRDTASLTTGDRVKLEVSPCDFSHGRIVLEK
jgi:translation initiation factor IF-1